MKSIGNNAIINHYTQNEQTTFVLQTNWQNVPSFLRGPSYCHETKINIQE